MLPAAETEPDHAKPEKTDLHFGQGNVLIMDDEEMVRLAAADMIRYLGFEVSQTSDGLEALSVYQTAWESNRPFDLVILDLTVAGGMGGKETVRRLLEINPDARVVVSSGYSNDPVMAEYRKHGFVGVIPKPYTIQSLNRLLRQQVK